jgi:hypothetical protein
MKSHLNFVFALLIVVTSCTKKTALKASDIAIIANEKGDDNTYLKKIGFILDMDSPSDSSLGLPKTRSRMYSEEDDTKTFVSVTFMKDDFPEHITVLTSSDELYNNLLRMYKGKKTKLNAKSKRFKFNLFTYWPERK